MCGNVKIIIYEEVNIKREGCIYFSDDKLKNILTYSNIHINHSISGEIFILAEYMHMQMNTINYVLQ